MGAGSTLFQALWTSYHNNLITAVLQQNTATLRAIVGSVQLFLSFAIVIFGMKMVNGSMDYDAGMNRIIRGVIVVALLTPAHFQAWIVQTATVTVPQVIASSIPGATNTAQAFDAISNAIENLSGQLQRQAVGLYYIGDRAVIGIATAVCEAVNAANFGIALLATATIAFLVMLAPFLIPFYLFPRLEHIPMHFANKAIGLFLVLAATQTLSTFTFRTTAQIIQQYGHSIPAARENQNFATNANDITFTAFQMTADVPGGPGVGTPVNNTDGATINITSSIQALWNIALVAFVGWFLTVGVTALCMTMTGGFSPAPAGRLIYNAVSGGVGRVMGGRRG